MLPQSSQIRLDRVTSAGTRVPRVSAGLMAALVSVLATACSDGSADSDGRAMPLQRAPGAKPVHLRRGVVAMVDGAAVTRGEFERVYAARVRGLGGGRGTRSERRLRRTALVRSTMSQLILAEGVARQAETAGVSVSRAQVGAALVRSREPFAGAAEWRGFLKRTGQSEAEVRARLRLELLNRRLYAEHAKTSPGSAVKAVSVARRRLRASTACRPGFVVALCANSISTPTEAVR